MIKVAIKDLMKASPALPLGNSIEDFNKSHDKPNLFKNTTKQKNFVLVKTTYKLVNCDDFFREAHQNGYLRRFSDYQNGVTDGRKNYQQMAYEWSPHVIIAFWSLMVCSKYYEWVPIDLTINNVKKHNVEDLFKIALSSDDAIKDSLKVHKYDPISGTKTFVINLPMATEIAFNNVRDHVLKVAELLCDNQCNPNLDWDRFFDRGNFPAYYKTAIKSSLNPLVSEFLKEPADWDQVKNAVLNTFYPETNTGEPVNRLNQMLTVSDQEVAQSIKTLASIEVKNQNTYEKKQLYDIVRRVKRLEKK